MIILDKKEKNMPEIDFMSGLHKSTSRDYLARVNDKDFPKAKAAELAKMGEVLTNSQIGGRRNIVINGAMRINQRGTSSHTLNSGNTNGYIVDRFNAHDKGIHDVFSCISIYCTHYYVSIV